MFCRNTEKEEPQYLVQMDEDGVYLECAGCGKQYGREIGYFADKYS